MNITLEELSELLSGKQPASIPRSDVSPWVLGHNYLIRTVTNYFVGTLVFVGPTELALENVSWIPDTGRFYEAVTKGELAEVEPYPESETVIIGRLSITDACQWMHALPREQI